jgi:hypothetical protein
MSCTKVKTSQIWVTEEGESRGFLMSKNSKECMIIFVIKTAILFCILASWVVCMKWS